MIYRGSCHCGTVRVEYETDAPVRLRQDGCGFCSSRGVKSASDPNGRLVVVSQLELVRYRFGHKTADFLICPTCGTYVATRMEGPRGPVGVVNVVGLAIPELKDEPATLTSLDGESVEERIRRRLSRWTPMTLREPAP
ncbi:MAG TPA: aldehyde-activating protein [Gammaproteobacteria bacterium]